MLLLQARTRLVQHFQYPPSVEYAILSHTFSSPSHDEWPAYESYELAHSHLPSFKHHIINKTCELALSHGVEFVWIDAVCVDKTSSARISETINSIANYFKMATICFAYLFDLPCGDLSPTLWGECQFWSQIWTLQELIFPPKIQFYDAKWHLKGERSSSVLSSLLSSITGVDEEILTQTSRPPCISAARKLSWAAERQSLQPEDAAYGILGLFDVSMNIIYGEGAVPAFIRLQEHILNRTNDGSVLLWTAKQFECRRGLFAHDAQEFVFFGKSSAGKRPLNFSGFSISTSQGVLMHGSITTHRELLFFHLGTPMDMDTSKDQYGILLQAISNGVYARYLPQRIFLEPDSTSRSISTIFMTREEFGSNSLVDHEVLAEGSKPILASADLTDSRILELELHKIPGLEQPASESPADINPPPTPGSETTGWIDINLDSDQFSMISGPEKNILDKSMSELIDGLQERDTDAASCHSRASSDDNSKQSRDSDLDFESRNTEVGGLQDPHVILKDLHIDCTFEGQTKVIDELARSMYSRFLKTRKLFGRTATRGIQVSRNRPRHNGRLMNRRRYRRQPIPVLSELSCPFYSKDPTRHAGCLQHHRFMSMDDIRSHLWTAHRLPYYCPICKLSFSLAFKRNQHIVQRICRFVDNFPFVGVSEDHKKLISHINTSHSSKTQWYQVWDVLFPGSARPESPYPNTEIGVEVVRFRKYWDDTGTLLLKHGLEKSGLESFFTDKRKHHLLFSTIYTRVIELLVDGLTESVSYV